MPFSKVQNTPSKGKCFFTTWKTKFSKVFSWGDKKVSEFFLLAENRHSKTAANP